MRRSLNGNTIIPPPLNITLFNYSSFSAFSFIVILITANICYPLGQGHPSYRIVYTSTLFSILKHSITNLLTFLLSTSIANAILIQSIFIIYHLGLTSFVLEMYSLNQLAVVYQNATSQSLLTENLITLILLFVCYTQKPFTNAPASLLTPSMPRQIIYFTASVIDTFSTSPSPTQLILTTSCRIYSLSIIPALVIRDNIIPNPTRRLLPIINTYIYIKRGSIKIILSYTQSNAIISWNLAFWLLRYSYSALIIVKLLLTLLIMLFQFAIILLYYFIIFSQAHNKLYYFIKPAITSYLFQ